MISRTLLLLAILLPLLAHSQFSCRDQDNNPVDWFAALKYPEKVKGGYGYIDSTSPNSDFAVLPGHVDNNGGALANTIAAINSLNASLIVYNDEPPNAPTVYTGAHAKGFVAWDGSSRAVYIMHSAPKYPNVTSDGQIIPELNENAYEYGQNFFCVNLEISDLKTLQENFQTVQLSIYYKSGTFAELDLSTPYSLTSTVNQFQMSNGDTITLLSKSPSYNQFLYEGIIEPFYETSLMVESWGRPYQTPDCSNSDYISTNVDEVKLINGDNWESYYDHSKWAVSFNSNAGVACASDMNRMNSQIERGGSAFCYQNAQFYNAFKGVATSYSSCSGQEESDGTVISPKFEGEESSTSEESEYSYGDYDEDHSIVDDLREVVDSFLGN